MCSVGDRVYDIRDINALSVSDRTRKFGVISRITDQSVEISTSSGAILVTPIEYVVPERFINSNV